MCVDIIGNFATQNNPSISLALANGANTTSAQENSPLTDFPQFDIYSKSPPPHPPHPHHPLHTSDTPFYPDPIQINLNQTGGTETSYNTTLGQQNSTIYVSPGLQNDFSAANAYEWEAGRGFRCDFWRSVGSVVPE